MGRQSESSRGMTDFNMIYQQKLLYRDIITEYKYIRLVFHKNADLKQYQKLESDLIKIVRIRMLML